MHGTMHVCKHCAKSKTKQKNAKNARVADKAMILGQKLNLDLLKFPVKSRVSANVTINHDNWKILVCKATGKMWIDLW